MSFFCAIESPNDSSISTTDEETDSATISDAVEITKRITEFSTLKATVDVTVTPAQSCAIEFAD